MPDTRIEWMAFGAVCALHSKAPGELSWSIAAYYRVPGGALSLWRMHTTNVSGQSGRDKLESDLVLEEFLR